jgi:fructoselysine-6-P-deglycase FrlB-like protein
VVVVGCGTSEHAALAFGQLIEDALGGRRVEVRQAFEASLDPRPGGICIAISHGGSSNATNAALSAASGAGARTAAITATPGSRPAQLADIVVETPVRDASFCHTIGYLEPLLTGGAIAASLRGGRLDVGALAEHVGAADAACAELASAGVELARSPNLVVVGSGVDTIAARELTLKIEEGAWIPTAMRDSETFLHGHLPACDERTGLIVLVTDPVAREQRCERAANVLVAARRCGVETFAVVDRSCSAAIPAELTSIGRIELPAAGERLRALAGTAIALQRLTLALSLARGTNPDLLRRHEAAYREARDLSATKTP